MPTPQNPLAQATTAPGALAPEPCNAADKGIAPLVEAEQSMGRAGDSNALADTKAAAVLTDWSECRATGRIEFAEPQGPSSTQIDAVETPVNLQGQRQPAGTSG